LASHNGGVKAFEKLANEHKDAVYRHMIRVCGNREDAEDVLIEALLKAYRHLDQLRDDGAFRPWLAQIAKRVCWQLKKREALLPLLQLSMLEEEGKDIQNDEPPVDAQLAAREMKELFQQAVRKLPPLYQDVYRLRDIEDLPGPAVEKKLVISQAAMKSRLHRARDLMRQYLDEALAPKVEVGAHARGEVNR
jgi:RNA polymerase sigma-70 factor (ECF subfamily)